MTLFLNCTGTVLLHSSKKKKKNVLVLIIWDKSCRVINPTWPHSGRLSISHQHFSNKIVGGTTEPPQGAFRYSYCQSTTHVLEPYWGFLSLIMVFSFWLCGLEGADICLIIVWWTLLERNSIKDFEVANCTPLVSPFSFQRETTVPAKHAEKNGEWVFGWSCYGLLSLEEDPQYLYNIWRYRYKNFILRYKNKIKSPFFRWLYTNDSIP